ncbi:MAG: hypothetical protein RLZZ308_134 [Candidatus Parcubacteria bacterium]|jgi:hypothetical protein
MQIIVHRVNTIERLKTINPKYGVEIDIRGYGEKLLLNHDPIQDPSLHDDLESYLKVFSERGMTFIVFNTKEAGYESKIIELAEKYTIPKSNYFLLDVEYPYMYRATRKEGVREIAVRYSEGEPVEYAEAQTKDGQPLLDWVWIDTNTQLPLNEDIVKRLKSFKTCLVCPERWGRPEDISLYRAKITELGMSLNAVMTAEKYIPLWEE